MTTVSLHDGPARGRPGRTPHGWARGLIHFHARFSDGWASIEGAARLAARLGFDFLIVTDHLRDLKLKTRRTLKDDVAACDRASDLAGIPVLPGGKIEVKWSEPLDRSEGRTLLPTIRVLVEAGEFDFDTPDLEPVARPASTRMISPLGAARRSAARVAAARAV